MENVREWAAAVSCACVIAAMLSMVFQEGSGRKMPGMIISLMVICVLLKPVISLKEVALNIKNYSFDVSQYENTELEAEVQQGAKSVYSSYLEQNLMRVLDGADISYESVEVRMDNSEDGCISIGQVEVIVKNEDVDRTETIKRVLRGYIGFDPVVRACDQKGSE